jgi:hypothetical protein
LSSNAARLIPDERIIHAVGVVFKDMGAETGIEMK